MIPFFKVAVSHRGVIVTNDNYRDLNRESKEFKEQIDNRLLNINIVFQNFIDKLRLLPYTWFKDEFLPSDDPLGKNGPNIQQFLRH